MWKRAIAAGLLGWIVLMAWTFVVNGILGFQSSIDMKPIPAERQVYETLSEHIVEPGRYICNPEVTPGGPFPGEEPVFSILFGGMGHGAAGSLMLAHLFLGFLAPMIGVLLLCLASERVLASYPRKVMFFAGIGLLVAVFSDLTDFGIGNYPPKDAVLLAAHDIIVWTVVGLAIAWIIKPGRPAAMRG